ncbi:hypothetical protein E2C01_031807 [Portunus trituberculatus]|uniref:Uncharacterized protein n=1 Tax=Portunus trituberculatus TaxID=210409 RepID=A0A5B7EUF0_PORTR|nr:hypothetical protein [Portunus trituberculatus]
MAFWGRGCLTARLSVSHPAGVCPSATVYAGVTDKSAMCTVYRENDYVMVENERAEEHGEKGRGEDGLPLHAAPSLRRDEISETASLHQRSV